MKQILCAVLFTVANLVTLSAMGVTAGQPAPALNLPGLDGKQYISLEQYKGKVVYLDFWASWCGPCRKSFPHFQKMRKELGDYGFEVLAVNVDEDPKAAHKFLEKIPVDFPILLDPQGNSPEVFGLKGMPTSYLIDQQGVVRLVHEGFKEKDVNMLKAEIIKLLGR